MKIIARTREGFICEVHSDEIRAVLSIEDGRRKDVTNSIIIGDELTFTTALHNLNLLKDLRLSDSYSVLRSLIDATKKLEEAINIVVKSEECLVQIQQKVKNSQS